MAETIAAMSERCMATGFVTWAHRISLEYLVAAGDDARAAALRSGERIGATAMAGAFRTLLGLEPLALGARRTPDGGLLVDGTIPWASNLVDGALIVTAAAVEGEGDRIVVLDVGAAGLAIRPHVGLLGLDATASGVLRFDAARVEPDGVLDVEFGSFLRGVRPVFLALQTGFCLGLARAALDAGAAQLEGLGAEPPRSMAGSISYRKRDMAPTSKAFLLIRIGNLSFGGRAVRPAALLRSAPWRPRAPTAPPGSASRSAGRTAACGCAVPSASPASGRPRRPPACGRSSSARRRGGRRWWPPTSAWWASAPRRSRRRSPWRSSGTCSAPTTSARPI